MKVMDSCPGQGASRSEGCTPSQGLQRRNGCEDALSCFDTFGVQYQTELCLEPLKTAADLQAAISGTPAARPCSCALGACAGWESLAEYRWEAGQMTQIATLRDPAIDEPTFEEFHPAGTRYDSPQAPVAVSFFPYNRCDVWHCGRCDRHLLRYTEFGGYNVDHRVRVLDAEQITG